MGLALGKLSKNLLRFGKFSKYLPSIWQVFGKSSKYLASIWQVWQVFGKYLASIWQDLASIYLFFDHLLSQ